MSDRPTPPATSDASIRPVVADDLPALRAVIDATGLFPSELLPEMLAPYLEGRAADDLWFTVVAPDNAPDSVPDAREPLLAVAYVAPERYTDGTWNLYLIAVHAAWQSRGTGARLLRHVEDAVRARGARVLLVETSGLPTFARTRAFYHANGYAEEARIRAFYAEGEDKVVFWKAVGDATPAAT